MKTNDSLTKLRRDFGKVWEIFCQLVLALERRGGTVENLFSLLNQKENSTVALFHSVAALLMGEQRLIPIDPLEILTKTGKSDEVRCYVVTSGGIKEEDLPVHLLTAGPSSDFCYPRTRMAIVERVTDQAKLKEIALKGGRDDGEFAASKLTSFDDLYDVAMSASYLSTVWVALARLPDEYLGRLVKLCKNNAVRSAAVAKMTDQRKLRELYSGLCKWIGIDAGVTTVADDIRKRLSALRITEKNS